MGWPNGLFNRTNDDSQYSSRTDQCGGEAMIAEDEIAPRDYCKGAG
jgi:hypothetical protein